MNQGETKSSAIKQYHDLLSAAYLKKCITQDQRVTIGLKRKELGLTLEEANTIQIMVLGAPIGDVVEETKQTNGSGMMSEPVNQMGSLPNSAQTREATPLKPTPSTNEQSSTNSSLGIGASITLIVILVAAIALFIAFPISWPVLILAGISKLLWAKFVK